MKNQNVILVGCQNTGKSTLFNCLIGKKRNIISPESGVTRDLIKEEIVIQEQKINLYDLPGCDIDDTSNLTQQMLTKIKSAIDQADLILYVLSKEGPTQHDHSMFGLLRNLSKPVIYVINKVDRPLIQEAVAVSEYSKYGLSNIITISSKGKWNLNLLKTQIYDKLNELRTSQTINHDVKNNELLHNQSSKMDLQIAIIGKPNSGKSSLFNYLLGKRVALVDTKMGTTRDSLREVFEYQGKNISLIDTAGLRKISKMQRIDFYSAVRTLREIERADFIWFLIPSDIPISRVDRRIFNFILKLKKPYLTLFSKSDLIAGDESKKEFFHNFQYIFPEYQKMAKAYISVQNGQRTDQALKETFAIFLKSQRRISTKKLQEFAKEWHNHSSDNRLFGRKFPKIKFIIQSRDTKPTFVFFTSSIDHIKKNIVSYFEKKIQEKFYVMGIPVKVVFRKSTKEK